MTRKVLILRPQPGSEGTAARAAALGLPSVRAPLFDICQIPWEPPQVDSLEAVLVTSANAARHAGPALARFARLPCYAVGENSAAAARQAGFGTIHTGPSDGAASIAAMEADSVRRAFHPCGRDHIPLESPAIEIERRIVYAAEPIGALSQAAIDAVEARALVLLHSPRAAEHFAALIDAAGLGRGKIDLAAISPAAAAAAGDGWRSVAAPTAPRDHALLELAAKLCQTDGRRNGTLSE